MLLQRTSCWILSHSRVRRLKISAFSGQLRQLFELHSVKNVGRSILRASEVIAIQIHRRGVANTAARGDGRDCAASFCLFCRVFVCFGARCCRCSSEEQSWSGGTGWVLRGYRDYCWGTAGVLLEYCYSRCSSEEPSSIHFCGLERFHELLCAASRYCHAAARCRGTDKCAGQHAHDSVSGSLSLAPNQSGCGDSMSGDGVQHEQEYAKTNWPSTRPVQHGHDLVGRT
jgi:hypothetical protein